MKQVIGELERLQTLTRRLLILQRFSLLAAGTLAVLIAVIGVDYLLRLPSALRLVLLAGGLSLLTYAAWTYFRLAVLFRPSLTQLALRIEHALPGAGVAGRLASSVEFAMEGLDVSSTPGQLAQRSMRDTQSRLAGATLNSVVSTGRTWRDVLALALIATGAIAFAVTNPAIASTGLSRVFLPYGDAKWPARTGVESFMVQVTPAAGVFPRGAVLPLRAHVTRGPAGQRVDAHYRVQTTEGWDSWQRIVLTHQGDDVQDGRVHERLVDTNALSIEMYFTTDDDQTERELIELVPPPAVLRASLTVTPPTYAAGRVPALEAELGPGVDERAVTEIPSLVGSDAVLRLELNKAIPAPTDEAARDSWLRNTLNMDDDDLSRFAVESAEPTAWTLRWTIDETRTLSLSLVDEHGLRNVEPISYRITAVEDRPPGVTITQPQADEVVLPEAVVSLAAEARDDVSVSSVGLEAVVQGRDQQAAPAPGVAPADGAEKPAEWMFDQTADAPAATVEASLELRTLKVQAGDTVLVTATARDGFELNDKKHETARSAVRRLRVIGETEFATQLRRQLGAVRQNAIRIEALQGELQDDLIERGMQPGMDRGQAQLGERIAAQGEAIEDIERLLEQNRLKDDQLSSIVDQTRDLLDHAGRAANRAVEAMEKRQTPGGETGQSSESPSAETTKDQNEQAAATKQQSSSASNSGSAGGPKNDQPNNQSKPQAGQPKPGSSSEPGDQQSEGAEQEAPAEEGPKDNPLKEAAPEDEPIVEAQQEVRDELTDLIKLLDRDEDTWVARRQLENMMEEQARLSEETANLGEQTVGKSRSDLSQQELSDLDRIAQKQRDLRDKARQMIEDLRKRAEALKNTDPQSAQGMRDAADRAEQQQLDRDMEEAAERIDQNQMRTASAKQEASQETMQRMLNDIQNTKRAQAQELIRRLASLIESIQRLVTVQENELIALDRARAADDFGGLDRNMIRLTQNTQAVENEARTAGQETRRVARSLSRAADAQGAAVAALRAKPMGVDAAETAENRSLELLKEALASAQEAQKDTEEQEMKRRREELIAAYRGFAEQQVAVRGETLPLTGIAELDRRQLVEARRLGSVQDQIRNGLAELRQVTAEVMDSPVFMHVHRMIEDRSLTVTESLQTGTVTTDITDRQQFIAQGIGQLIKALEESLTPPDEFAKDQQQGEQGGAGGQPQEQLIPPIAQIKLLRGVQELIYMQTQGADAGESQDAAVRREKLRDLGQQQRELMDLGQRMLDELKQRMPDKDSEAEDESEPVEPPEPGLPEVPEQPEAVPQAGAMEVHS